MRPPIQKIFKLSAADPWSFASCRRFQLFGPARFDPIWRALGAGGSLLVAIKSNRAKFAPLEQGRFEDFLYWRWKGRLIRQKILKWYTVAGA